MASGVAVSHGYLIGDPTGVVIALDCVTVNQLVRQVRVDSSAALFKKKIGDTEYGIGWFPLGGYVKIAGMMDESMDEEALKLPPKPDEYRSKKNWQKLIIMLENERFYSTILSLKVGEETQAAILGRHLRVAMRACDVAVGVLGILLRAVTFCDGPLITFGEG